MSETTIVTTCPLHGSIEKEHARVDAKLFAIEKDTSRIENNLWAHEKLAREDRRDMLVDIKGKVTIKLFLWVIGILVGVLLALGGMQTKFAYDASNRITEISTRQTEISKKQERVLKILEGTYIEKKK